jgi:hypothetical protein
MKTAPLYLIIILSINIYSQSAKETIESVNRYTDSLDLLISNSSGLPGEISCNRIITNRNVRAIGSQETKISFYFYQADDIAYEDSTGMRFIPVYNSPLKIMTEYNIAASQSVKVSYYHNSSGNLIYRSFLSAGEYGNRSFRQYYEGNELIAVEIIENGKRSYFDKSGEIPADEINTSVVTRKFSDMYLDMYYDLFGFEQIDK